jgi:hypothetical protein
MSEAAVKHDPRAVNALWAPGVPGGGGRFGAVSSILSDPCALLGPVWKQKAMGVRHRKPRVGTQAARRAAFRGMPAMVRMMCHENSEATVTINFFRGGRGFQNYIGLQTALEPKSVSRRVLLRCPDGSGNRAFS